MRFVTRLIGTAAGIATAAWLFEGIGFVGATSGMAEVEDKWLPLLIVSLIMGVISSFVKPIVQLLSIPLILLTIGVFLLVINALMLLLVDWIAGLVDLGFYVDGFWVALWGSIVITVVSWGVDLVIGSDE